MTRTTPINRYRNIGICAHVDAGRTTTTERVLFYTGVNHKPGGVCDNVVTTGWVVQGREHDITITSAAVTTFWKGSRGQYDDYHIDAIDTPGHVDFTIEVERSLYVLNGTVVMLCDASGVESQLETVWHQINEYDTPHIVYINKTGCQGANFLHVVEQVRKHLGYTPAPVQLAIGAEESFVGQVNLVKTETIYWDDGDKNMTYREEEIPAEPKDLAEEWRLSMAETAVEASEELMNKYLEEDELPGAKIREGLRLRTLACEIVPVVCGSSFRNKGIPLVPDAVIDCLPAPTEIPATKGISPDDETVEDKRHADDNEPFSFLAFRIAIDPFVDTLTFAHVYSGVLSSGDSVLSSVRGKKGRVGRMVQIHTSQREEIKEVHAGDIVALIGMEDVTTGDTLCSVEKPIILKRMDFPEPVVSVAVELEARADQEGMGTIPGKLAQEDPSFRVKTDGKSGQTITSDIDELHLDIIIDRMKREFGVETNIGRPWAAYRKTVTKDNAEIEGKFVRQSGSHDRFGRCWIHFLAVDVDEKGNITEGLTFENGVVDGMVPKGYTPATQKGVEEQMKNGVVAGYPLIGSKATVFDGSYHDVDSNEMAFRIVASIATKQLAQEGGGEVLEPIMKMEVVTPKNYMGDMMGDLNRYHGLIQGIEGTVPSKIIRVEVPLGEIFGYVTDVRSMSQGHASYSMGFSEYTEAPSNIVKALVKR